MKINRTPCRLQDIQAGELFSSLDAKEWDSLVRLGVHAYARAVYLRTDVPLTADVGMTPVLMITVSWPKPPEGGYGVRRPKLPPPLEGDERMDILSMLDKKDEY